MECQVPIQTEVVEKYLNRQLDEAAEEEFEVHILDCPDCSSTLEALLIVRGDLLERAAEIRLQKSGWISRRNWRIIGLAFACTMAAIVISVGTLSILTVQQSVEGPISHTTAAPSKSDGVSEPLAIISAPASPSRSEGVAQQ